MKKISSIPQRLSQQRKKQNSSKNVNTKDRSEKRTLKNDDLLHQMTQTFGNLKMIGSSRRWMRTFRPSSQFQVQTLKSISKNQYFQISKYSTHLTLLAFGQTQKIFFDFNSPSVCDILPNLNLDTHLAFRFVPFHTSNCEKQVLLKL